MEMDSETLTQMLAIYAAVVSTYAAFLTTIQVGVTVHRWKIERESLIKVDVSYAFVGYPGSIVPILNIDCVNVGMRRTKITNWGIPAGKGKYIMDLTAQCNPRLPAALELGDVLSID